MVDNSHDTNGYKWKLSRGRWAAGFYFLYFVASSEVEVEMFVCLSPSLSLFTTCASPLFLPKTQSWDGDGGFKKNVDTSRVAARQTKILECVLTLLF
jgi:hypothetical protein